MSLRRRLILSLVTILLLFAINVGTHFWGGYARNQSMEAYRNSVTAAQLSTELEQLLDEQRQKILVLATLRETTDDRLDATEQALAAQAIDEILIKIRELGRLSHSITELYYEQLWQSSNRLLDSWLDFYRGYNDPQSPAQVDDPLPYVETQQRLQDLKARQAFIAQQRATIIDRTISLTDRITVIAFLASIFLTAVLGYFLVRFTSRALKSLKRGTERFGSGDLNYRIDNFEDAGELGALAIAFNDMSDKLRGALFTARKARDAADEANAAKSIFLANVSHELRTPLNAIIGYSEMLQEELDETSDIDRPQFRQDLDRIISSGRQLLSLINEVLDLSKIETGKMSLHCEIFNPSLILKEVCESMTPLFRENFNQLRVDNIQLPATMYNDPVKFRQVFTNLLSNANKFTEQGAISLWGRSPANEPDWVEITVRDTGIGMTQDQLARVFDAFVQADSSTSANYGGTGLGLAICREFCELMGGTILAQSQPGAGSTFTVRLPTDPGLAHAAA